MQQMYIRWSCALRLAAQWRLIADIEALHCWHMQTQTVDHPVIQARKERLLRAAHICSGVEPYTVNPPEVDTHGSGKMCSLSLNFDLESEQMYGNEHKFAPRKAVC